MDESAEARLVDAARRGSFEAFSELVRRSYGAVYELCLAVSGDTAEAERLSDESFRHAIPLVQAAPAGIPPRVLALSAAWRTLHAGGWFASHPDDARVPGPGAAFPELSRELAAVAHLVHRARLSGAELAAVVGISPANAAIVVDRLPAALERRLGATTEARTRAWASAPTAPVDARRLEVLRARLEPDWPERAPAQRAATPRAPEPAHRRALAVLALPLAAAAAFLAAVLLVPASPLALTRQTEPEQAGIPAVPADTATPRPPTRTATPAATVTATPTATSAPVTGGGEGGPAATATPTTAGGTPTPTRTAASTTSPSPGTTPSSTPTPSPTTTPTPTPTPTATPMPCRPRVGLPPNLETITMRGDEAVLTVFNQDTCGDAEVAVLAGDPWLQVEPASATIPAFRSLSVTLHLVAPPEPGAVTVVTVRGPANAVSVLVEYSP
jgi:hypothetical protein